MRFMAQTQYHTRNPYVIRYVKIANCPLHAPLPQYYWWNAENLLQRFGRLAYLNTWHIHLCPRSNYIDWDTIDDCYKILEHALVLLLHLKKL